MVSGVGAQPGQPGGMTRDESGDDIHNLVDKESSHSSMENTGL